MGCTALAAPAHAVGQRCGDAGTFTGLAHAAAHRSAYLQAVATLQAGFSPLGDLVVACYRNDTIFLWSATTFDLVAMLRPPQQTRRPAQLRCWDLSPDDRLLLAGGSGGQVFLWDLTCQVRRMACDATRRADPRLPRCAATVDQRGCARNFGRAAAGAGCRACPLRRH